MSSLGRPKRLLHLVGRCSVQFRVDVCVGVRGDADLRMSEDLHRNALSSQMDLPTAGDPIEAARRVLEQSVKAAVVATSEELETAATGGKPSTICHGQGVSLGDGQGLSHAEMLSRSS